MEAVKQGGRLSAARFFYSIPPNFQPVTTRQPQSKEYVVGHAKASRFGAVLVSAEDF